MKIALNADVGEGMINDEALMSYLTYANIACGGHFGDVESITKTIGIAKEKGVKIGAHPSYLDKENFGRKSMRVDQQELELLLKIQIDRVVYIAKTQNIDMHHVKLHGALYNDVFANENLIDWFLNWISKNYKTIKVFVPIGAKKYIDIKYKNIVIYEAFADRNYNNQLQLISRNYNNASIEEPGIALKHVENMFLKNILNTIEGGTYKIEADTFCLHGDNPNVLNIADEIYQLNKV